MAKKIKKKNKANVNVELMPVEEELAFEIGFDEEMNEIIFMNHYRTSWGDDFDGDSEHVFNLQESREMVVVLLELIEKMEKKINQSNVGGEEVNQDSKPK